MRTLLKKTLDDIGIDLAVASKRCGKNHAYFHQFIHRGVPKRLPEEVRAKIAKITGLTEEELGKPRDGRHIPSEEIAAGLGNDRHYEAASRAVLYQGRIPGAFPEIHGKFGMGPGDAGEHQVIRLKQGATLMGHKVTGEWVFPPEYMSHTLSASPTSVFVVQVDGDSMMPVLMPGDRVIVDASRTAINPDGLYAIDEGMGPQIKQVELVRPVNDPPQVRIVSVNQSYSSSVVALDELTVLGRVCARITRM